jgi:hypothetical protein
MKRLRSEPESDLEEELEPEDEFLEAVENMMEKYQEKKRHGTYLSELKQQGRQISRNVKARPK